ncbi:MAG: hypothetical protein AB8G18_11960 [Gammaproteobacteria bacterium]
MTRTNKLMIHFPLLGVALLATGCVSTTVVDVSAKPAIKAVEVIPEDQLVDIGITLFDPNVPEDPKDAAKQFINRNVRQAEAAYVPYQLRKVLEETENWGAVRLIPRPTEAVDLVVNGKMLKSDGEILKVHIVVNDTTGRSWIDKTYTDRAGGLSYDEDVTGDTEPFLDLYNNIANDLLTARRQLSLDELSRIRTIAKLKFAAAISPYAYEDYYAVEENQAVVIKRLPSNDDPMLDRIEKIREREYAFIDLLDEHYESFYDEMSSPYEDWRRFSYEETVVLRELKRTSTVTTLAGVLLTVAGAVQRDKATTRGGFFGANAALYGGINLIKGGFDLRKQSKLNAAALAELGDSFSAEVKPMLVEVQGRTVELSGTADQQYSKWRELLREIYESETGLEVSDADMKMPESKPINE